MPIICNRCHEELPNNNVYYLHLIGDERCYKDGSEIAAKLNYDIQTRLGEVEYIMRRFPETQHVTQDILLEDWHAVIFQKRKIYNYTTHQFEEIRGGHKPAAHIIKQDNLGRAKRKIKETDKKWYHNSDGSIKQEHECVLGSGQSQILSKVLEQEHRRTYGMNL